MDLVQILGLLAAFFTTVANVPQAIKVIKTRSTKSLSAATYAMLFYRYGAMGGIRDNP